MGAGRRLRSGPGIRITVSHLDDATIPELAAAVHEASRPPVRAGITR